MIADGVLPSVNLDGCIRIPEEILDQIIRAQLEQQENQMQQSKEYTFFPVAKDGKEDNNNDHQ